MADMIRLQRYCGCCRNEIYSLKLGDLQLTGEACTAQAVADMLLLLGMSTV